MSNKNEFAKNPHNKVVKLLTIEENMIIIF